MLNIFMSGILLLATINLSTEKIQVLAGPNYSSYLLYRDSEKSIASWQGGVVVGINNIIPNIGLKLRGSKLRYQISSPQGPATYEYMPVNLCTTFDLLPFLKFSWINLSAETGFGLYWWRGLTNNEVIVLPGGEKIDERDFGFVGGGSLLVKPFRFIGIEFSSIYNYIASSNLTKYGYYDKDEKIWSNGFAVLISLP